MQDLGNVKLKSHKAGEPLRILQLTDLHLFPADLESWHNGKVPGTTVKLSGDTPYDNQACLDLAHSIARRVKPHLVVITGDGVDGRPFKDRAPDSWKASIASLVDPLVKAGANWAMIPGNHEDEQSPWKREDLMECFNMNGCIHKGAKDWDHTMTVGATRPGAAPVRLFFLDSGGNDPVDHYGTPKVETVAAMKQTCEQLVEKSPDQMRMGLSFFHIPPPEVEGITHIKGSHEVFQAAMDAGLVPRPWCWMPKVVRAAGRDRVASVSKKNTGLFKVMAESKVIRASFFGHDHHSDAVFLRDGHYMAYGRYGSTLPPSDWEGSAKLPFPPGARVIEVSPEGDMLTWVETAEGELEGSRLELEDRPGQELGFYGTTGVQQNVVRLTGTF